MDRMPLGAHEAFRRWSGHPRSWGAQDRQWRAWFAGKVVDGLCHVLDDHLAVYRHGTPAAIGCVPWLTSEAVVDRLLALSACCVVLDKGAMLPRRLVESDRPLPNTVLPGLDFMVPADEVRVLGPSSPMPPHDLGPVRLLGWRGGDPGKPLIHAKLLVLGEIAWVTYSPDVAPEFEELHFLPQAVWWGSANWTEGSRSHLEVGFWCDDPALAREATAFVSDLIAFSEPVGSTCAGPAPNLVTVEFDDEAMAEAAREQWLHHLADEEDEDG